MRERVENINKISHVLDELVITSKSKPSILKISKMVLPNWKCARGPNRNNDTYKHIPVYARTRALWTK